MNETYVPDPIDTSEIELDEDVAELLSKLIVNAHEVWARQRIEDGWSYGPRRSDEAKEHPCLVSYEDLPESEKEYDRVMVTEALKGAIALGFTIKRT
jgi:RyR domain